MMTANDEYRLPPEIVARYQNDAAFHAIVDRAVNLTMRRELKDTLWHTARFAELLYSFDQYLVRENASMKDSVQRLHMAVSPTFVIERGADPVVIKLVAALRQITDNVWAMAKESFDTNEGKAEQDFHESDPAGFEAWLGATEALRVFDGAQKGEGQ